MKHCILPAVLLCMTLLAGCTGRKVDLSNVTESTIGVNGDGSVEEVVIESFDKEYYSLSDLTAYVNKQVDAFNQANPQEQPKDKKSDDEEITAVSVHCVETDPDAKTAAMALTDNSVSIDNKELLSQEKLAIILGTEGEGLMAETIEASDYTVKIPMANGVDSLNVAAASAVAFWQISRKGE